MGGRRLDPKIREQFWTLLQKGYSVSAACREVGISLQTGYAWTKGDRIQGHNYRSQQLERQLPLPKRLNAIHGDAKDALTNFELFRRRYLGRKSTPWQLEAADLCVKWLTSGETEFTVINCPPGSGKSTLFTHDIPTWLICKNRNIRIMIGSANLRMASKYSARIRRTLERVRPLQDAASCVAVDYGRFKPELQDIWRAEEFVVLAHDDEPIEDKEPTVSAFGMETEFLGTRANFVVWDDLVTNKTMATPEKMEKLQVWWDTEGETRLEPGGLLLLQGQRMGAEDLYRYALDQKVALDEDDIDPEEVTRYNHITFPAHFEDRCHSDHGKDAAPFPTGCLLDPIRLPWRGKNGLATIQQNKESKYRVQYQQEDVDPEAVLVKKVWVDGGRDSDGTVYGGCWDNERDFLEIPPNLQAPVFSIATADPSPTKYWSVQWWLYQPATNQRFLIDMFRGTMDSPDFLDWVQGANTYVGLVNDWQIRSRSMGFPITHWIVENNAAQRFMLQYDFVHRWRRIHNVDIIGHSTQSGRSRLLDVDYGIQLLKNVYKYGQCRFPGKGKGRVMSMPLITEVTRYPEATTDDCLMAQWFLEYWIPQFSRINKPQPADHTRPSWVRSMA
jgi:hypothetical protein